MIFFLVIPIGMSVTAGKYFGSKVSYAAGAPRSNGTGQVVIFTKVKKAESQLSVQLILSGEQFASSYGYTVATVDLNGDRYKINMLIPMSLCLKNFPFIMVMTMSKGGNRALKNHFNVYDFF